jgi:hypothetical protein
LIAYPLVQAMFGATDLSIVGGLIAALVGALTTVAAFLGVSLLLRAPELTELRGRS